SPGGSRGRSRGARWGPTSDWLASAEPRPSGAVEDPAVAEGVQNHVLAQLLRLRSYPFIDRKLAEGGLTLRGWYYEVHTGAVREHRAATDSFEAL
ncbi:carbonic anhydrase, partial [Streptomyces sp. NPDC005921]